MQSGPGVDISMDSVEMEAKKQDLLKKLPRYLILQVRSNRWVWIEILSVDLHDELYISYFFNFVSSDSLWLGPHPSVVNRRHSDVLWVGCWWTNWYSLQFYYQCFISLLQCKTCASITHECSKNMFSKPCVLCTGLIYGWRSMCGVLDQEWSFNVRNYLHAAC